MKRAWFVGILRNLAACVVFGTLTCGTGFAQSLGTTFSDLWWNPAESGWGVTVDHQQDVMFLTFFIYRADGSPYWVAALLTRTSASDALPFVFSGDVYEYSGPYFGGPFNPSLVNNRKVGTAIFSTPYVNSATLTYTVDGVTVTKSLQRQTLQNLDFSGVFNGVLNCELSGCANPSQNGQQIAVGGPITIVQSGGEFQMLFQPSSNPNNCGFVGSYSQTGSLGSVTGTFSCSEGTKGSFSITGLQWTIFGMSGAISAQETGDCAFAGLIGGTGVH